MAKRILTISREFGSGGRTIGRLAAEKLGWAFYDREMVDEVAKHTGFAADFVERNAETVPTGSFLFDMVMYGPAFHTMPKGTLTLTDQIFFTQSEIIRSLADEKPCVIVGRCADDILRKRSDCLNVFIHADMMHRAEHVVAHYGVPAASAEKELAKSDQLRRSYYRHYTGRTWGKAQNYHLSLDSGVLGIEQCVDIIVRLCEEK